MTAQVSQNFTKNAIKIPDLPSDIYKVVGMSNLLLIDIFSDISAFFYELYQKGTKLFENFSTDFTYEANRYSVNIKKSICEKILKLDLFHFSKGEDKKDMKKIVGKINLLMIDAASYVTAFFKVLSHRLSHEHFLKDVKITALRFSYNIKVRFYSRLTDKEFKMDPISYPNDLEKEDIDFRIAPISSADQKREKTITIDISEKDKLEVVVTQESDKSEGEATTNNKDQLESMKAQEAKKRNYILLLKIAIATLFLGYFVMFSFFTSNSRERGFQRSGKVIPRIICVSSCHLKQMNIEPLSYNAESNCYDVQVESYC